VTPSETENHGDFAPIVAAAEQVLTRVLGQSVRLGDVASLTEQRRRNVVLRCRNLSAGTPSSVIIKHAVADHYDPENTPSWDVRRFLNDWAGAAFLSTLPSTPHFSPRFYAGDRTFGLFILEDLGAHRSLVEPLLEENAASATAALRTFATTLGKLHAATIGQSAGFERLCKTLHPSGVVSAHAVATFSASTMRLQDGFERLAVRVEAHFQQELEAVGSTMTNPGPFFAYIHGDPCPDNISFIGDQVRLIDFEFGRFGHALLDGAYGRMMFPTCWCANRLPGALVAEMESVYRAELVTGCPEAQDDHVFETALSRVCAFWALNTLDRHLTDALQEDRPWGIATIRPRLLARLEAFITTAETFGELPAVRATASRLLEVLRKRWPETSPLPLYPAFRKEDVVSQRQPN
jgi:hypothetical protein